MSERADLVIRKATVILPEHAVTDGAVAIRDGRVTYAGTESGAPAAGETIEAGGGYVVPGFVDLHLHGGGGYDATCGRYDPRSQKFDSSEAALREGLPIIARTHASHGTTTLVPTTYAVDDADLLRCLAVIGKAAEEGETDARLLGANVEGRYICHADFAGAQNPEFFREPSIEDFDRLNEAARGRICIVNIAPEYGEPAVALVRHVTEKNIVAASGHTGASDAQMTACIDAGLTLAVHYSNGPTATSFKPPGMAMEAMLRDPRVVLELIADSYHVNPPYLLSFLRAKHFRAALVTDAMPPVDAPGITEFTAAGKSGVLSENGGVLRLKGSATTLFGSILTMDRAVANLVRWLTEGLHGMYQNAPVIDPPPTQEEALVLASRLASGVPAEVLGRRGEFGAIEPGLAADLVLLGRDLDIQRVWVNGRELAR